ncbi:UbiA prenyltransferase family-domain-containing protein [Whalleya microplaca]|nr:UbiA prenyltransferase family-domain-containing protein [Whalleya microplaca]
MLTTVKTHAGPGPIPQAHRFPQGFPSSINIHSLLYHAHTGWLFICNDIKNVTPVGVLFAALNASVAPLFSMGPALSPAQMIAALPPVLLWSWSNLFLFDLHNQRRGVGEDALNKPWRPLPSGRLSLEQATLVIYCMYLITFIITVKCGGLVPCLLESVFCLWYNEWAGSDNPFLKNFLNGLGIPCFFVGPLEVATGHSIFSGHGKMAAWISIIAGSIAITSHIQDFRDVEGDKASGRVTVPLVIGDTNARLLATFGVGGFTAVSCWFWEVGWREGAPAWTAAAILVMNLFLNKTQKGDDLAWKKLWFLWMLGLFTLPLFVYHR